jgi:two-component system response regulator HydG
MIDTSNGKPIVAVVDDEPLILESWEEALGERYSVKLFSDPLAARQFFEAEDVDVALLDIRMPGLDGMSLMQHIRQRQPTTESIIVTGHGTIQMAVEAIQQGAYDFLCKPIDDLDSAVRRIESAIERKRLREVNANLRSRLDAFSPETELIGDSRAMRQVRDLIVQVADAPAPVLICGESGTGKELAARALHRESDRCTRPFLAINCAAISESLLDSELFGHEKGAFTGATTSHKGLFEAGEGGVLFLDEIGDVPTQTQVRLLRALQEGEIRPVGSTESRQVDVRVVAATNVNLELAMKNGRFREDLYYRISTFRIDLPPLRDRPEDIPPIAQHLLVKAARRGEVPVPELSDASIDCLMEYDWPGNVRELNNALEHAAALRHSDVIEPGDFPTFVTAAPLRRGRHARTHRIKSTSTVPYKAARDQLMTDFEKRYLDDLLVCSGGNISEASRRSGIDRANLRRMLRRHALQAEMYRRND